MTALKLSHVNFANEVNIKATELSPFIVSPNRVPNPALKGATFTVQNLKTGPLHTTVTTQQLSTPPKAPENLFGTKLVAWQKTNGVGLPHVDPLARNFQPASSGGPQMYDARRGKDTALDVLHLATDVASFGFGTLAKTGAVAGVGMLAKTPKNVAITGANGDIGFGLTTPVLQGLVFGSKQPVNLQLIVRDTTQAGPQIAAKLKELEDSAHPLLNSLNLTDDLRVGLKDADVVFAAGAAPRTGKMNRNDLLQANGATFTGLGKALNEVASRDVKTLVIGNPANTNTWLAWQSAPDLKPENFSALMRLDQGRTEAMVAKYLGVPVSSLHNVLVLGNHSNTMIPFLNHATVDKKPILSMISKDWFEQTLVRDVRLRGGEILAANKEMEMLAATRGRKGKPEDGAELKVRKEKSSVLSPVAASINHMRDWVQGTEPHRLVTMALPFNASHLGGVSIPKGTVFGAPVTIENGVAKIFNGIEFDSFTSQQMMNTLKELVDEQAAVAHLIKK